MEQREKIRNLFDRYSKGQCTPEEQAHLHKWFNHYTQNEAHGLDNLSSSFQTDQRILSNDQKRTSQIKPKIRHYAAAVLILTLATLFFFQHKQESNDKNQHAIVSHKSNDVLPGGNRAKLTLADGTVIDLSTEENGIVVGADEIAYNGGSETIVNLDGNTTNQLVLSTPVGGTYQLTLSDGTQVWLNAGSTLRYPSHFAKNERLVEIEGEAYFSVSKDKHRPFRVLSRGQKVEVLGTEFNVSAYDNDNSVMTTLVSGAIRLDANGKELTLVPGDQSEFWGTDNLKKQKVDIQPFIAWKKGEFYFENTPLTDMLKQLSRWYDVEVVYERKVPNERFSGAMSRNVTLQTVLRLLKISEINYRLEKNKLIIE
ncbi:FecR family protein [Sphingobacterium yanglingense]|uniref:FecR family protein n=1 Tax=Sphingobacterium yanglingense TaxID=1437280 RepID=A0A4R6WKL4_9SPHI|nr:FecR family protein [Sphingobacterium yanglingense]TDQ76341.1 FecR family protein [Sphingobacterium yanglingense]